MEPTQYPNYSLPLSSTCRRRMEEIASRDQISTEHFITLAIAERISRMEHEAWLKERMNTDVAL